MDDRWLSVDDLLDGVTGRPGAEGDQERARQRLARSERGA